MKNPVLMSPDISSVLSSLLGLVMNGLSFPMTSFRRCSMGWCGHKLSMMGSYQAGVGALKQRRKILIQM